MTNPTRKSRDTLVVYYSRSGCTRTLAQGIAIALDADLEEIVEPRSREGALGFIRSLYDVARGRQPTIETPRYNPLDYRMVVIGSPVWAGHVSSPVRTYIARYAIRIKLLSFFCTMRSTGAVETLAEMAALHEPDTESIEQGRYPKLSLTEAQVSTGNDQAVSAFVDAIQARMRSAGVA